MHTEGATASSRIGSCFIMFHDSSESFMLSLLCKTFVAFEEVHAEPCYLLLRAGGMDDSLHRSLGNQQEQSIARIVYIASIAI